MCYCGVWSLFRLVRSLTSINGSAAATVFFWERLAHALVFHAGIPYIGTLAFAAGIASGVVIFVEIVT